MSRRVGLRVLRYRRIAPSSPGKLWRMDCVWFLKPLPEERSFFPIKNCSILKNANCSYLWILVGRDCDELSLGKGVSQNASLIGADPYDVNSSLVLVQRIEHNLHVKQFGNCQISIEGPFMIVSIDFSHLSWHHCTWMAYYFNKIREKKGMKGNG